MCGKRPAGHDKEEGLLSRPDVSFKYLQLFLFPGESAQNEATLYHQKHMVMTLLASFFYSAHLPERLAPGCFDYIGACAAAPLPLPPARGGLLPLTPVMQLERGGRGRESSSPGRSAGAGQGE